MTIDAHTHMVPARLPGVAGATVEDAGGGTRTLRAGAARVALSAPFFDPRARIDAMDRAGIAMEVVSPLPQLIDYSAPSWQHRELCTVVNEQVAEFCANDPDRLIGLGIVPLQDPELAVTMLAELRRLGLRGVELGASVGTELIGDARFAGVIAEAARCDLAIFVHALPSGSFWHGRLSPKLVPTFGMPGEVGLAAASLILGEDQPTEGARIAFSHGGGGFAWALSRAQLFWARENGQSFTSGQGPYVPPEGSPMARARRFAFDTAVADAAALDRLVEVYGPDSLILGTDYPASERIPEPISLSGAPHGGLSTAVLDANARRWLGG